MGYKVATYRKYEQGVRPPSAQFLMRLSQWLEALPAGMAKAAFLTATSRLPTPVTSLVGRDEDAAEVVRRVGSCHRVTLLGAPGIGKTRLAIEAARRLENTLANGACFVPLARLKSHEDVPAAIGRALQMGGGAADQLAWLEGNLREQEVLIVLDNCEHVLKAAEMIGRLLDRCPKVRLLATSREPLRIPGEVQFRVKPLSVRPAARPGAASSPNPPGPAAQLFAERAMLVRPDFVLDEASLPAVTAICAALDGLPFAIELAAAHMGDFEDPAPLLADLRGAVDLPIEGPTSDLVHFVTLRGAIDWSYQLLSPELRSVFDRVGVFQGPFSHLAGAAVALGKSASPDNARLALTRLRQKSLLEPMGDSYGLRFEMLESIRHYALDRLKQEEQLEAVELAHATHYLKLAESAKPHLTGQGQSEWLSRLEREYSNIVAAIEWTLDHDPPVALRLLVACWRWLWVRSHLREGREWLNRALAAAPDGMPERVVGLNGEAVLARSQGDVRASQDLLQSAERLARERGDTAGLALTLLNLAVAAEQGGHLADAETLVQESLTAFRDVADDRGVGHALNVSGNIAIELGQARRATPLFEESLSIFRRLGDDFSAALPLANLGWVAYREGNGPAARSYYLESAALSRALQDDRGLAHANMNLGRVDRAAKDTGAARERLEDVLLVFFRIGEERGFAETIEQLSFLNETSNLPKAVRLLARADALRAAKGAARLPEDEDECRRVLDKAASQLGLVAVNRLSDEGAKMSLTATVAHALGGAYAQEKLGPKPA